MSEISDAKLNEFYPDPQQEENVTVCYCDYCNKPIYVGEDLLASPTGDVFCEDCFRSFIKLAEIRED